MAMTHGEQSLRQALNIARALGRAGTEDASPVAFDRDVEPQLKASIMTLGHAERS